MSTLLLGRICRTCLLESSTMHKLLDIKRDHLHIEEMLCKTVPNFDLSVDAEIMPLPVEICDDCWEKLQLSYDFQQLCMFSNELLESLLKCREKDDSLPSSVDLGYKDLPNEIGQQKDSSESVQDLQEDIKMEIGEELVTVVQLSDCVLKKHDTLDLEFLSDAESVKDYDDRDVHLGYKKYECKMCYKNFPNRTALNDHRRTHTEESPYLCSFCGKSFKREKSRWMHLQIHGEKNWQCPECPMRFYFKYRLRRHMSTHSKEKPFVCDICGSSFKCSDTLTRHKLTHGQRRFKCKECNLSFVFKGNLDRHLRTHLEKNTYL